MRYDLYPPFPPRFTSSDACFDHRFFFIDFISTLGPWGLSRFYLGDTTTVSSGSQGGGIHHPQEVWSHVCVEPRLGIFISGQRAVPWLCCIFSLLLNPVFCFKIPRFLPHIACCDLPVLAVFVLPPNTLDVFTQIDPAPMLQVLCVSAVFGLEFAYEWFPGSR